MSKEQTVPMLISPKDAAAMTTLTRQTLSNLASAGVFPAPVQLGERRTAYVRAEVIAWIEAQLAARALVAR